jgi:Kef-type K+ transport system membrane component KefB
MEDAVTIIVIALAAFLLPFVADHIRVPAIVLEIMFGIVVGPSLLGLIHSTEVFAFLAELGFFLLMFLSGFEIDLRQMERGGKVQIFTALAVFGLTLFLANLSAGILGYGPFMTLLLATTSVGLVVPTLRTTGMSGSALGQAILMSALAADFLTLVAAAVFAMVTEHGVGWHLLNFPVLFLLIAMVLLALRRYAWWHPEKVERMFARDDPEEIGIRACLALMFVFVGLSYPLKVEPILGAFLAGTVFAMVFRHRGHLEQKMSGFSYGFLVPVFFIHVGVEFDLRALMDPVVLLAAVKLLVAAILVKLLAAGVLLFRGHSPRKVLAAGVLLSTRMSLVIAMAELGTRLGLLDRTLEAQIILLAVVTAIIGPTLFRMLMTGQQPAGSELQS